MTIQPEACAEFQTYDPSRDCDCVGVHTSACVESDMRYLANAFWLELAAAWEARDADLDTLRPRVQRLVRIARAIDPSLNMGDGINAQRIGYAATFGGNPNTEPRELLWAIHAATAP